MYITQANWETAADGIEFMDTTLKTLKASLEAIRDNGDEGVKRDRAVAGGTFDAMEMQRVPVYKALYDACSVRNRWEMSPMQKHGI